MRDCALLNVLVGLWQTVRHILNEDLTMFGVQDFVPEEAWLWVVVVVAAFVSVWKVCAIKYVR
jgi:hypothetical protein